MVSPARAPRARTARFRIRPWTRGELARLPDDGNRYEVLDGQLLVTPQASRAHQRVAFEFALVLERYVRQHGAAHVVGPGAVPFGKNELQPDVLVVPGTNLTARWDAGPAPILIAEVLSRSTSRRDFGVKLDAYLDRVKVPTVWIVDRDKREVQVCVPGQLAVVERATLVWKAPGLTKPLVIDLPALFREALGA